ncbi:hypothetical protein OPIT5_24355 [Opitutaceae bacterium TAV5]|nr:hypothetical protein OPIT5_24355 [Opitutaceae bacterium TAV5]
MSATHDPDEVVRSQREVLDSPVAKSAPNAWRILFIGDSITRHGIKPELGWNHVAGMAASQAEKDYVHLLAERIRKTMPDRVVEIYYDSQARRRPLPPDAGQNLRSATVAGKLYQAEGMKAFRPHLVVIQLGEHDRESVGEAELRKTYAQLIESFSDLRDPQPLVICTGVWVPGNPAKGWNSYEGSGWSATIERVFQEVCTDKNVPFASVRDYALDPTCRGWGEHKGVKWHPNDKGMEGYATVLFRAFQEARARRSR